MSKGVSTSTDKIIVDKSRSHRNKAVSKAVRATRERLQAGPSNASGFAREMLGLHIDSMLQGAIAMPIFLSLVTGVGVYLSQTLDIVAWAMVRASLTKSLTDRRPMSGTPWAADSAPPER